MVFGEVLQLDTNLRPQNIFLSMVLYMNFSPLEIANMLAKTPRAQTANPSGFTLKAHQTSYLQVVRPMEI